jgi:hypothetical protein
MVNDDGFVMAMGDADEFVGVKEKLTAVHWVLLLLLLLLLLLMPLSNSACPEWTEFPIFHLLATSILRRDFLHS